MLLAVLPLQRVNKIPDVLGRPVEGMEEVGVLVARQQNPVENPNPVDNRMIVTTTVIALTAQKRCLVLLPFQQARYQIT